MRNLFRALCFATALAAGAAAQTGETFVITKSKDPFNNIPTSVYEIDSNGVVFNTLASFSASSYEGIEVLGLRGDNQSLLMVVTSRAGTMFTMSLVDLSPTGKPTLLHRGAPLHSVRAAIPNCDGDTYLLNNPSTTSLSSLEILRLRGSTLSLYTRAQYGAMIYGGTALDPETGCLLFKGYLYSTPLRYGFFQVDPHTGTFTNYTTLDGTKFSVAAGCRDTVYDFHSATAVDVLGDPTCFARTARLTQGGNFTWVSRKWWGRVSCGLVPASQRNQGAAYYTLCVASTLPTGGSKHWDLTPIRADGTWGKSQYLKGNPPMAWTRLVRRDSRHLSWRMVTPPNGRALDLSFPGEAGRNYLVAFSAAGIRPGIGLPDGRVVPIVADALTVLTTQGGIPGVLTPTTGRLDSAGRASVKVDTNGFGTGLKGTVLWIAAVVFDPKSPSGVAWIVGPERLEIRK